MFVKSNIAKLTTVLFKSLFWSYHQAWQSIHKKAGLTSPPCFKNDSGAGLKVLKIPVLPSKKCKRCQWYEIKTLIKWLLCFFNSCPLFRSHQTMLAENDNYHLQGMQCLYRESKTCNDTSFPIFRTKSPCPLLYKVNQHQYQLLFSLNLIWNFLIKHVYQ